jgi:hypothetical protein
MQVPGVPKMPGVPKVMDNQHYSTKDKRTFDTNTFCRMLSNAKFLKLFVIRNIVK